MQQPVDDNQIKCTLLISEAIAKNYLGDSELLVVPDVLEIVQLKLNVKFTASGKVEIQLVNGLLKRENKFGI